MKRPAIAGAIALCAILVFAGVDPALARKKPAPNPAIDLLKAPASEWRPVNPENLILMDLPAGTVAIEMRPDLAPKTVEQIKALVRQGFYDGLKFHRVIEGFVAQGGDPKGDGTGHSDLPNLPAEFTKEASEIPNFTVIGRDRIAARVGLIDGLPAAADPESLRSFLTSRKVNIWGANCPGVLAMARATEPNSGNSQFFLDIGDARTSLDSRYTVWGWVVDGLQYTRRIERGEPPKRPTPVVRMRIAADAPEDERPKIEVMKSDSPFFLDYVKKANLVDETGFVKDLCDIKPPRKVDGKFEMQ